MSDRIVIDPDHLRRIASRMRGGATLLSSTGRQLAGRALPAMPASVTTLVAESLARVNGELQDLALGLARDADDLSARATWAELGEGPAARSSSPWIHSVGDISSELDTTAAPPALSDEQLLRAEGWSLEIVERTDPVVAFEADDASALRYELAGDLSDGSGASGALTDLSLTTEGAPDLSGPLWELDVLAPAGQGALAAALTELSTEAAGVGILGCIAVGGNLASPVEEAGGDAG